ESLLRINIEPEVKLIDFRTRRQDLGKMSNVKYQISKIQSKNQKFTTKNPPGTISISAIRDIKRALANYLKTKRKQLIIIKGEEDLLALPAILLAPLHSLVLYGQIDLGVVIVEVTVKKKKEVEKLLKKFD
ncbi:DUF359 domain-containing protein, partial [Candidatus Roizmanbacteria bacterium]|nr:DUF359 domain-containing protein [Candidatus Roizmanbacteria bacterium]